MEIGKYQDKHALKIQGLRLNKLMVCVARALRGIARMLPEELALQLEAPPVGPPVQPIIDAKIMEIDKAPTW